MKNDKKENAVVLVECESTYNYMIDTIFYDSIKMEYFYKYVEVNRKSKILNFLKKDKVQKLTKGIFNIFLNCEYKLYNTIKELSLEYKNVFVIFLNSSFLEPAYPYNILSRYKKKIRNVKYILFYIDIISHPVSHNANVLRNKRYI